MPIFSTSVFVFRTHAERMGCDLYAVIARLPPGSMNGVADIELCLVWLPEKGAATVIEDRVRGQQPLQLASGS